MTVTHDFNSRYIFLREMSRDVFEMKFDLNREKFLICNKNLLST